MAPTTAKLSRRPPTVAASLAASLADWYGQRARPTRPHLKVLRLRRRKVRIGVDDRRRDRVAARGRHSLSGVSTWLQRRRAGFADDGTATHARGDGVYEGSCPRSAVVQHSEGRTRRVLVDDRRHPRRHAALASRVGHADDRPRRYRAQPRSLRRSPHPRSRASHWW